MFQNNIIRSIKYLIYLLVVVIPLFYFPTIMFPFQLSKTVIFQILTEIIFALWLGLAILNKKFRPKLTLLTISLCIFMFIAVVSAIFGSDWRISLWSNESRSLGLVGLFHFFSLFLVAASLKREIGWEYLWSLSFGSAVAVSLIGISQKFLVLSRGSNEWFYIIYSGIPERIGSTFSNPAFMAGYLLFNFFIGLYILFLRKTQINTDENINKSQITKQNLLCGERRYIDWLLVMGAILILIAIFLSQTIGVILGLSIGILILLFYSVFQTQFIFLRKISAGFFGVCIILLGIFWLTHSDYFWQKIPGFKRIASISFQQESIRSRLIAWESGWEAFKEKPILGWGPENFRIAFDKYYNPKILFINTTGTHWDKPHNIVLEYLTATGIIGLLAYLSVFILAFYTLIKKQIKNKIFFVAIIIAYFVQNLFIFDTIGTYLMFFLTLAFINSYSVNKSLSYSNDLITNCNNLITNNPITVQRIIFGVLLIISLVPIYYNYQIFKGANYEYWGVNYFLNRMKESSLLSFNKALMTSTPYIDDIRKNFADVIKQAYQQGIEYPNLADLQDKLAGHLRLVIQHHQNNFLNYIILAEFENVFHKYNSNYAEEAEKLAQKALELSPKRQQTYYVLTKTKLLQADIQGAYNTFEAIIKLHPTAAEPHFYLGLMAYGLGDIKTGSREIGEAERLGRVPQKIEEFVTLGNFAGDLEYDYKKAIKYYISALNIFNNKEVIPVVFREDILLKLAIAYYFDKNYEKSSKTFLELKEAVDLKTLPIYENLKPVLQELGIENSY
ncbi:MAG: O-antigen ligase family protein [Patescibacteria group bacterium]|nr:O-antigen ligase family protein [Patescibacteria group bacterium]